jgi:hypothetical protein
LGPLDFTQNASKFSKSRQPSNPVIPRSLENIYSKRKCFKLYVQIYNVTDIEEGVAANIKTKAAGDSCMFLDLYKVFETAFETFESACKQV